MARVLATHLHSSFALIRTKDIAGRSLFTGIFHHSLAKSSLPICSLLRWSRSPHTSAPPLQIASWYQHSSCISLVQHQSISTGVAGAAARDGSLGGTTGFKEREILVQHLLLQQDQLQLLLDLQRRITQEGVDLSDLATEHSICPSKSEGGMLGWLAKGRTVPEFEEAAFNAPLNKLVRVKTKHGWHLLQVLAEREATFLQEIGVEEFHARLQDSDFTDNAQLVDVRELDEIATAAIEGFKAYPLSQFGQWAPTIADDLDKAKDTFVLCHHGMRSLQAANWLKSQGFTRLYNIKGGIHAYSVNVDNSIPKY